MYFHNYRILFGSTVAYAHEDEILQIVTCKRYAPIIYAGMADVKDFFPGGQNLFICAPAINYLKY